MKDADRETRGLAILHVSQPTSEGVGRIVALLVADQVRRGWDVSVASPTGRLATEVQEAGADWHRWPARRNPGPGSVAETIRLRRIVSSVAPHVVHLHSAKAGLAGRCVVRGRIPTIFEPNAWSFHAVSGSARALALRWERFAARWASVILCVSATEQREGEAAWIRAPWLVITNGVDTAQTHVAGPAERLDARSRLGIPADVPFVVSIGRLSPQKGQDVLLEAWPSVRASVPTARLALVGDGPLRAQLASELPVGVQLVGQRDDADAWLAAADVAAMPSRWEGMSLALLEAMAVGRSVVATDVAGVREALGPTSSAVVPVGAAGELALAIRERLEDPARAAAEGAANRSTVEARFSLDRVHDAIAELTLGLACARPMNE